ncbi:MAG TPA: hypothetical protein VHB98_03920 [Chloroflexota bacterium]|nr:hypothetical protein [Chloroflexota bacterium]
MRRLVVSWLLAAGLFGAVFCGAHWTIQAHPVPDHQLHVLWQEYTLLSTYGGEFNNIQHIFNENVLDAHDHVAVVGTLGRSLDRAMGAFPVYHWHKGRTFTIADDLFVAHADMDAHWLRVLHAHGARTEMYHLTEANHGLERAFSLLRPYFSQGS